MTCDRGSDHPAKAYESDRAELSEIRGWRVRNPLAVVVRPAVLAGVRIIATAYNAAHHVVVFNVISDWSQIRHSVVWADQ